MTPNRLLDVAIREFGAKGLEGASTRGIAAAAGTAMSAITYHYGGKEGLYLAAGERIGALMSEHGGTELADADAIGGDDPRAARDGVVRVLLRMVDTMVDPDSEAWALFIVREQLHPSAAFEAIYASALGRMLATLARLVRIASGVNERAARVATITLLGQTIALRASRAMFVRLLGTDRLDDADLAEIKTRITANTYVILDRLSAEARNPS